MNKFKLFFEKHLKLSILDIALAGIFVGVWLVASKFLVINTGAFMRTGITYAIAILVGLYFKPLVAVLIAVIADTFSLMINDGLGYWMWQYAIIYPLLVLLVSFMKWLFKSKDEKLWMIFSGISFLITTLGAVLVASLNNGFANKSGFDFSQSWLKILIWVFIGIMFLVYIGLMLMYKKNKNENLKYLIIVYSIVSIVIVLFIWIWGPYADIKFASRFYGGSGDVAKLYKPALIARVLKTPVILPLYSAIVYPLYKVIDVLRTRQQENKWA